MTDSGDHALVRLGGWLFARRTWLGVPLAAALLALPAPRELDLPLWSGLLLVGAGELLRLWSVRHIGVISRTRTDRLGPLISTGPFGWVRNPLYLGNIALWVGFTVSAGLLWLTPLVLVALAVQYHAIVRWEERLLESRQGETYRAYLATVPRWLPRWRSATSAKLAPPFSWRATLVSERGTLLAIGVGCLLLELKSRF